MSTFLGRVCQLYRGGGVCLNACCYSIVLPCPFSSVQLLVDVRRAVSFVRSEGRREQYTAMVAVGNMKVSQTNKLAVGTFFLQCSC
jgi:hypothetical protein